MNCKSVGITRVINIFDLISNTVCQTHFKFGGDVPWVSVYQVYLNGHASVIFEFFINFLLFFGET